MEDIIVVEGLHDEIRLKSIYPNCNCVITNGSEISKETLDYIKELSKNHNIIIFTDPDSPGEKIRSRILEVVPNAKNAFIRKKDSISHNHKKVGVEHAKKDVIIDALDGIYNKESKSIGTLTNLDLFKLGLNGDSNSAKIRNMISNELNIGMPNSKQFLKRCNTLGITYEKLEEMTWKIKSDMKNI